MAQGACSCSDEIREAAVALVVMMIAVGHQLAHRRKQNKVCMKENNRKQIPDSDCT